MPEEQSSLLQTDRPTIIELHQSVNEYMQRAFASFVLYNIYKEMFVRGLQPAITHAVIFDEAHKAARLSLIPTMAKECRKYGISFILASQEARDFDKSVFSAIANYLLLKVNENEARALAKNVVSSDVEKTVSDKVKQLSKFTALFISETRRRPVFLKLLSV